MGSPPNEQGSSSTSSSSTATAMRRNQEDIDEPLIQYLFRRTVGGGGGGGSGPTAPSAQQPSRLRVSPVETVFGGGSGGDGTGNRSDSPIDLERVTIPAPLFPPQSSSLYQRNVESNDNGSGHDSSPYRLLLSGFNNRRREHGRRDYEVNKIDF